MKNFNWGNPEEDYFLIPNTFYNYLPEFSSHASSLLLLRMISKGDKQADKNTLMEMEFTSRELIQLGEQNGITSVTARSAIERLMSSGFIERRDRHCTDEQAVALLKSKTPQSFTISDCVCEWCRCTTALLHSHHYPVRKCDGGRETVNICPNCHTEFHFLTDYATHIYQLTDKVFTEKEL